MSLMDKIKNNIPNNRTGRLIVGILLVFFGILGFLPVVGFWMIPLGLLVLSVDFPVVRRLRRRYEVKLGRWWQKRKANKGSKNV